MTNGPGMIAAPKSRAFVTVDQVKRAARSYKPTQQLARELGVSTRTIQRKLNILIESGYTVDIKQAWDGEYSRRPCYRVR